MNSCFRIPLSIVRTVAAIVLMCAGAPALAQSWGTQAEAFSLNCSSADCSGGGISGGASMFPPNEISYQGTSANNGVSGILGTSDITATLEMAAPDLATMRQYGEATGGQLGAATAIGLTLDLVTYSGPPTTVTITGDLTGSFTGPTSGADSGLDALEGQIMVFADPFAIADIDSEMSPRLFCLGECYSPDEQMVLTIGQGDSADSGTIMLDLVDGDSFYIYGQLVVAGAGGGVASSPNSFTYSFSPSTGLSSLAGAAGAPDTDGDGLADDADNCTLIANAGQEDSNGDGYGNACDADINNDGVINAGDLGLLRAVFFTADADADFTSDGVVNAADLGVMKATFFGTPGPSAFAP